MEPKIRLICRRVPKEMGENIKSTKSTIFKKQNVYLFIKIPWTTQWLRKPTCPTNLLIHASLIFEWIHTRWQISKLRCNKFFFVNKCSNGMYLENFYFDWGIRVEIQNFGDFNNFWKTKFLNKNAHLRLLVSIDFDHFRFWSSNCEP